jgi:hypothetical protein
VRKGTALLFACAQCGGLGWDRDAHRERDAHPEPCDACRGCPRMTIGELARRLDPKDRDWDGRIAYALRRVHQGRNVRASTGIMLLELLEAARMIPRAPSRQLEIAR